MGVLLAALLLALPAGAWFPPYDPAYLKPGAAPPVLGLAPLDAFGDSQKLDGRVFPMDEYASGAKVELSDWYTGMPPGDMHLQLAGKTLLVGIRVHPGDCDNRGCAVFLAIDEDRSKTLTDVKTAFGPEDRAVVVYWSSPANVQVGQWSGKYPLGQMPPGEIWPVVTRVGLGSDGKQHVEMKITLRTTAAVHSQPDLDPRTLPFGLAVAVIGRKDDNTNPSYYVWPNQPVTTGGQWIALPRYPYTYMTIQPEMPTAQPTGFLTYNVGLLPFLPNGGDGSPHDFASYAADPDVHVACLQELWDHGQRREVAALALELAGMSYYGLPHHCGGADDDSCDIGDILVGEFTETGITVKDTGLLLLSKSPLMQADVLYYKNENAGCCDADCAEEKGALHARVGTANARIDAACHPDAHCSFSPVFAGEQYIDVFCTHLQASPGDVTSLADYVGGIKTNTSLGTEEIAQALGLDPMNLGQYGCHMDDHREIQKRQLVTLGNWIKQKRVGDGVGGWMPERNLTDRPAVVMGDFNINGRNREDLLQGPSWGSNYLHIADQFDALSRTDFEKQTEIYSDRHDMGLGFRDPTIPYPPVRGRDPIYVEEVQGLAQDEASSPLPIAKFGEATMSDETARYDYVWVLPAWPTDELPFYAIAAMPEEPYVTVDPHRGGDETPASDHAAVYAGLRFVQLTALKTYNPFKSHSVTQRITHLQTLSYDGGLWAGGEDFFGHGSSAVNGLWGYKHNFKAPYDDDAPSVNWALAVHLAPLDNAAWWFDLWEDDPGDCCDNQYDMQKWSGKNINTRFEAKFSAWRFFDSKSNPQDEFCLAGLLQGCQTTGGTLEPLHKTWGTASESAVVTNQLRVVEVP